MRRLLARIGMVAAFTGLGAIAGAAAAVVCTLLVKPLGIAASLVSVFSFALFGLLVGFVEFGPRSVQAAFAQGFRSRRLTTREWLLWGLAALVILGVFAYDYAGAL